MLQVVTARIDYVDDDALDITRSGVERYGPGGHRGLGEAFAPSRELLDPYLSRRSNGALTDADWLTYREGYLSEMRRSYNARREVWYQLLALPRVVLLCFCRDPKRCHRYILAHDVLRSLGAEYLGERQLSLF